MPGADLFMTRGFKSNTDVFMLTEASRGANHSPS